MYVDGVDVFYKSDVHRQRKVGHNYVSLLTLIEPVLCNDIEGLILHQPLYSILTRQDNRLQVIDAAKNVQFASHAIASLIDVAVCLYVGVAGHSCEVSEGLTHTHAGIKGNEDWRDHQTGGVLTHERCLENKDKRQNRNMDATASGVLKAGFIKLAC